MSLKKLLVTVLVLIALVPAAAGLASAADAGDSILRMVPREAFAVIYFPEVTDFANLTKWSPIYNFVTKPEFGGVFLTPRGKEYIERFERFIKMPAAGLVDIAGGELAIVLEAEEFSEKGFHAAFVFRAKDAARWRSIFEDNFINNKEYCTAEKIDGRDDAWQINFSFPNDFYPEGRKKLDGRFSFFAGSDSVVLASDKAYLAKIVGTAASADMKGPMHEYFLAARKGASLALYGDMKKLYSVAMETVEKRFGSKKAGGKDEKDAPAVDMEMVKNIVSDLDLQSLESVCSNYAMRDSDVEVRGEFNASRKQGLVSFIGPDAAIAPFAALAPADASSLVVTSIDPGAILTLVEKIVSRTPFMVRTQYALATGFVTNNLGLRLREDIVDAFTGEMAVINKIVKDADAGMWISLPTMVFRLKNPKAAEKVLGTLQEKEMMKGFEKKELLGVRYFSQQLQGRGKHSVCFAVSGSYLVVSMNFDYFSGVLKRIANPDPGLASNEKYRKAIAGFPEKCAYFTYSNDEDFTEFYFDAQRDRHAGRANEKNREYMPFDYYDAKKVDFAKIKAHQAPSVVAVYHSQKGFEGLVRSGFKREENR